MESVVCDSLTLHPHSLPNVPLGEREREEVSSKMTATGYDALSIKELDLLFKEEFHEAPEEEIDLYLNELAKQSEADQEMDEAWERYIRDQEDERRVIRQQMLIVDSLLTWIREGVKDLERARLVGDRMREQSAISKLKSL